MISFIIAAVMDRPFDYYQYLTRRSSLSLAFRSYFIQDLVRGFSGRVLDIGAGAGEFSTAYPASIGVEINPYLAAYDRQKGLKISQASIFALPFADGEFDGVLVSNVLEHLADPDAAFGESARVLKPGGRLIITVPFQAGFRRDRTHRTFLQEDDLLHLASDHCLQPIKVYSYPPGGSFFGNLLTFYELRAHFLK
jgi:SAM-dependent methyltransferase